MQHAHWWVNLRSFDRVSHTKKHLNLSQIFGFRVIVRCFGLRIYFRLILKSRKWLTLFSRKCVALVRIQSSLLHLIVHYFNLCYYSGWGELQLHCLLRKWYEMFDCDANCQRLALSCRIHQRFLVPTLFVWLVNLFN